MSSPSKENMVLLVSEKQQITHSGGILHLTSKTIFFLMQWASHFLESRVIRSRLSLLIHTSSSCSKIHGFLLNIEHSLHCCIFQFSIFLNYFEILNFSETGCLLMHLLLFFLYFFKIWRKNWHIQNYDINDI